MSDRDLLKALVDHEGDCAHINALDCNNCPVKKWCERTINLKVQAMRLLIFPQKEVSMQIDLTQPSKTTHEPSFTLRKNDQLLKSFT
jgi:hypothetical protein